MAYLKFALRYFDVSRLLELVWSHLGEFYFLAICFSLGGIKPHKCGLEFEIHVEILLEIHLENLRITFLASHLY